MNVDGLVGCDRVADFLDALVYVVPDGVEACGRIAGLHDLQLILRLLKKRLGLLALLLRFLGVRLRGVLDQARRLAHGVIGFADRRPAFAEERDGVRSLHVLLKDGFAIAEHLQAGIGGFDHLAGRLLRFRVGKLVV